MKATLIVVDGAKPVRMPLKLPTVIGRSDRAKVKLRASLVSRTHCELAEDNDTLFVRDLGSSNGTYVNDRRIHGRIELRTDDFLRVGPVTFRVLYDRERNSEQTPTADPHDSSTPVDEESAAQDRGETATTEPFAAADIPLQLPQIGDAIEHFDSALVHFEQSDDGSVVEIEEYQGFVQSMQGESEQIGGSALKKLDVRETETVDADDSAWKTFLKGF